jgi:DNA processing protein
VQKVNPSEIVDHLRLARAEGVGPLTYRKLMRRYGSAAAALDALPALARAGGKRSAPAVPSVARAGREIAGLARLGARLLPLGHAEYPKLLALTEDAPPVIAVLGSPAILAKPAVALVGGRNASANGRRMAETLARELGDAGFVVVSGLARGVDAAAHRGALAIGETVAAVAGGLDVPYPPEHSDLQREIAARGAVVAEAPLGTAPQARHFPRRNRVIAGLALGVVVVEAAPRSGSLITARFAQEYGRELYAMPGSPLDPRCRGSNDLIRQGANLTESLADVLQNLPDHPHRVGLARIPLFARGPAPGFEEPEMPPPDLEALAEMPAIRRQVIDLLGPSPTSVDDLVRGCQFSPAAVMATLLELELAGRVETLPGNRVLALPPRDAP